MRQVIYILTSLLLLSSCRQTNTYKEQLTLTKNKKLIGFKTMFLSELGDDKYDNFKEELNKEKIEIKYLNDIIYVSYLEELNACGQYDGNMKTTGDTIKLYVKLTSDEVCTSTSIERIIFLIDNPDGNMKMIKR
ncbi:MAG: hypothetical protein KDC16_03775 [Saprospiraceae bacterium]|nr:hypothetical protein [Saprospiraceae bacterium]MCB9328658.1 hypothetical protein [Lewinellaceae bacterium]HPK09480.1 hypothetical protein [Saprospiraceae bacterium]